MQGPRCAVVGSGLAALAVYTTLRRGGLEPAEIAVLGIDDDPTTVWRERAAAIRQRRMRSESSGHLGASAFPGLALREVRRTGNLKPLAETLVDRYHPSVDEFLLHAGEQREQSGWDRSFVRHHVWRIRAVDGGFDVDGQGVVPHVMLATGHPGLSRPDGLEHAVHAYEPHEYASKVAIVGAGMAAATEWINALEAGAEVTSIRRSEPRRRPLNVPRPFFSKRGLADFHTLGPARRSAMLLDLSSPSYPPGRDWDVPLQRAADEGRFAVARGVPRPGTYAQVICATGFLRGYANDALLADLVDVHALTTHERWIVLEPDSTVGSLTDSRRTLSVAGVAGQWAFPAADTIAGAKYAAHGFLQRACRTR